MRRLLCLFGCLVLLTGCTKQIHGVEFSTVSELDVNFNLDIGTNSTGNSLAECSFSGDFGLSGYTYAEFLFIQDDKVSDLIVDIPNHQITREGHTHDYLRNKSFVGGLEVEEPVEILNWPVLDFTSIADAWSRLTEGYPLEAGTKGETQDGYEYYTIQRQAVEGSITGAPYDRLGIEEYTYVIKDGEVISLGVDVSYFISGIEFHKQKSIQISTLQ